MRILTVIAGLLTCGTGAFCFAVYTSTFSDVAFLVGVVMMISGLCHCLAWLLSGRAHRLTETTLVEGIVTFFYGFAVLSNQVTDSTLSMFFGTWLTLCGVTRFSQSLFVSRFNARDWFKILPLSAVGTMLGVVMMLPWIFNSVMPLMLVGGAFLVTGLSTILYAMYMQESGKELAEGEARAKARADAKKAERKAQRAEQDRLRSLSKEERDKEERQRLARERQEAIARQEKKEAERRARLEALRPKEEHTVRLTDEETAAIRAAAPEEDDVVEWIGIPKADAAAAVAAAQKTAAEAVQPAESAAEVPEKAEPEKPAAPEITSRPVWNKPESIPSVRIEREPEPVKAEPKAEEPVIPVKAVNLEEIENEIPIITFEKVELPEVEYVSEKESVERTTVMKNLDDIRLPDKQVVEYETVDLDELVAEPLANKTAPSDPTRFTQSLDFSWIDKLNAELKKQEEYEKK